jgi:hypothetical protein
LYKGLKYSSFVLLLFLTSNVQGQYLNIQHHLDFGKDRHFFTNTLEGLAFDDLGAWFGFIDVDHKSNKSGFEGGNWQLGSQLIYFEINRYFSMGNILKSNTLKNLDFTIQYNDSDADFIPHAYLLGFSVNQIFPSFMDAHLEFLFRQEDKQKAGWQLTGVWFKDWNLFGLNWQFLGYFDWWKNDFGRFFMAEPQLVFNLESIGLGKRFWFGTEWEINLGEDSDYNSTNPTIFLRYDF